MLVTYCETAFTVPGTPYPQITQIAQIGFLLSFGGSPKLTETPVSSVSSVVVF